MQDPGILWVWEPQKTAKTFWHRKRESCYSLHSNIQSLKWEMGKSKSISQSNKNNHSPGLIHPSVFNYPSNGFFYLVSWESICWCNESHSYANFLLVQMKFSFPLSHSITPKHHSQNVFSCEELLNPLLCLLKITFAFLMNHMVLFYYQCCTFAILIFHYYYQ